MRKTIVLTAAMASALLLSGCSTTAGGSGSAGASADGPVAVVASTDVYGQIAEQIGGDAVAVTSLITSSAQDPHDFQATAQDQLAVSGAQLIVDNGGGYDPFIGPLIDATGTQAAVITAVEYSDAWVAAGGVAATASPEPGAGDEEIEGFNEHVFYDPATIGRVAAAIADELSTLRPDDAATFAANEQQFADQVSTLEASLAAMKPADGGKDVFVTEPVPLYLTAAAGLTNVTPAEFSEAVEAGTDVPPATLLESLNLISGGTVSVVLVNAQTGGAETQQVEDAASTAGVPVLKVTETLPDGKTWIQWMTDNADALKSALGS